MIKYRLIRSNRKTLGLYITPRGLEVRSPFGAPKTEIDRFVESKRSWIEKHRPKWDAPECERSRFKCGYGDAVPFRGRECPIVGSPIMKTEKPGYLRGEYADGVFLIAEGLPAPDIRFVLSRIFKREAECHIPRRVRHYAALMQLAPAGVGITSAFGRWGSCSAKKRLNFAWMLMMADDEAIDSVVVHELAHMIHANHSAAFYETVYKYCPDYEKQRRKLRALGVRIADAGWKVR
ncbi:MAG: M48 family metallopeptidase [Clostridiales Family XIII bacterium]|jgi:predicted metal-dependent hydrolase|nr:M48 family metallopeptidase [Clostridiales Family XIII bacterium]